MGIQAISPSLHSHLSIERQEGISKSDLKTHVFVVLSYLLIGVGFALACSSFYIATIINPIIALATPAIPIALGILGLRYTSKQDDILTPFQVQDFVKGGPLGLRNPACNCWINSAFQLLCHASTYQELMANLSLGFRSPAQSIKNLMPFYNFFPLISAFKTYQNERKSENGSSVSSVDTQKLRLLLHSLKSEISTDAVSQEDPMELFEELHDRTQTFLPLKQKVTTVGKPRKGSEAQLTEFFIPLLPEKNNKKSFAELFNDYFLSRSDEGQIIQKWFTKAPPGFLVQPRRFVQDYKNGKGEKEKLSDKINFPFSLKLSKEQCPSEEAEYEPDVFIVHEGKSTEGGHYIAFAKINGKWWKLNDSRISSSDAEAKRQFADAYIVHYTKKA